MDQRNAVGSDGDLRPQTTRQPTRRAGSGPLDTGPRALPVAVIGAGPVGLVAAAHLLARGERPLVLEAGPVAGTAIREWGHVRLFSPWKYLVDPVAADLLTEAGWTLPDPDHLPTGSELVESFLEPLASHDRVAPHVRFGERVIAVARRGMDKVKGHARDESPFELVCRARDGSVRRRLARAVIDASGTYGTPNPLGAGGGRADGEREHASRIRYGIPDVLGAERSHYRGRTTLVVGSGHSAMNVVLDLAELARTSPGTRIVWAVRRAEPGLMFGGGGRDALPARGSLGARVKGLVDAGRVRFVTGFRAEVIATSAGGGLEVRGAGGPMLGPVDRIVAATGFRPDLDMLRELRLELDPRLEAPVRLAPLIDPDLHSCGTVYPHGYEELKHPERDFFVAGMKSYGRAPTFLMLTGYEQVRSIVAGLSGDLEGARQVKLELPETGVCSTDLVEAKVEASPCCGGAEEEEGRPLPGSCGVAAACTSEARLPPGSTPVEARSRGKSTAAVANGASGCCS